MADWIVKPGGLPQPVDQPGDDWHFDRWPDDEREQLRRFVEWISRLMDAQFEVPGVGLRFGLDPIIGLVPLVGELATTAVSLFIIALAGRMGLPRITLARMTLNVMVDMLVGAVPLVGDAFDVWWKANQRNARLLSERLADERLGSRRAKAADWLFVGLLLLVLVAVFAALAALMVFVFAAVWQALGDVFGRGR
jgi:hypothetical protein